MTGANSLPATPRIVISTNRLKERVANIDSRIETYLTVLDENDVNDTGETAEGDVYGTVRELIERREKYEAMLAEILETGQTQISLTVRIAAG